MEESDNRKRIVVVGGGFAGLNFVKKINKKKYEVVLVDRNNYHSFPPLFYQIASSGLEPGSICFPYRRELYKGDAHGAEFHLGEVTEINAATKEITTQYEKIKYDYLVLSAGTTNNFFGNNKLRDVVYTIKSTAQAMRCRDEILDRLERASICKDAKKRKELLSFVVVGGGPAGVEIAGALGEMKRYILSRNYPSIAPEEVSIVLLEGSNALLSAMSEKSQADAHKYLSKLMVDVRLGRLMKDYDNEHVTLDNGDSFYAGMVIWTAGVAGMPFNLLETDIAPGKGGRFQVDEYNRVIGSDSIYALGDIALMITEKYPHGHPQLAQAAIQQGANLAKNFNSGNFDSAFEYVDKGVMATVGRNLAVVDMDKCHLSGKIAWLAWMFIHLLSLLGMRNKISVFIDWVWGYFNYGTSLRLLFTPSKYPLKWRWGEK